MMLAYGDRLGRLKEAARALGELSRSIDLPLFLRGDMVWPLDHTRPTSVAAAMEFGVVPRGSRVGGAIHEPWADGSDGVRHCDNRSDGGPL